VRVLSARGGFPDLVTLVDRSAASPLFDTEALSTTVDVSAVSRDRCRETSKCSAAADDAKGESTGTG
jgi:hypothetical protein